MIPYYTKRVLEIIQKEGITGLVGRILKVILKKQPPLVKYYIFRLHTKKNWWINYFRYDAPAHPCETVAIDPNKIKAKLKYDDDGCWVVPKPLHGGIGQIKGGDWDKQKHQKNINEDWIIDGLRERFVEGKDWEDTIYYQELITNNDLSRKEINSRFRNYDKLYKDIKNNGYQKNHQGQSKKQGEDGRVRDRLEILVTIGKNGDIFLTEGHHRFAIAKFLDLKIPAHVLCRHSQWQGLRDDVSNNKYTRSAVSQDHPDLQNILS